MTVTEHIRKRLEPAEVRLVPDIAELRAIQWCERFEKEMRNRLLMGAFRYGVVRSGTSMAVDYSSSALKKLEAYRQDGNREHLVDAANYLLLEYRFPGHPSAHFKAVDDGEHAALKELRHG